VGRYKLTQDADSDVAEIYLNGLEMFGAAQAEKYAANMAKRFLFLAEKKTQGSDYNHVLPELRRADYVSHAIYYRHTDYGVLILRILHGRMDPGRHL
jgi:toxin ParE1/3/4